MNYCCKIVRGKTMSQSGFAFRNNVRLQQKIVMRMSLAKSSNGNAISKKKA